MTEQLRVVPASFAGAELAARRDRKRKKETSMKGIILRWAANTAAILIAAHVIRGLEVSGIKGAILAAAILGVFNALIRPLLLLLTLPLNILTLGLFTLIINGFLLYLVSKVTPDLIVHGFWSAVLGSLIISLISSLLTWLID